MREIKYRAWDKQIKQFVKLESIFFNYEGKIEQYSLETSKGMGYVDNKNITLIQYTGLKDKNGKEIYEGDIVKFIVDGKKEMSKVFFDEGGFSVNAKKNDPDYKPYLGEVQGIEVFGNIYENPELLENKK